MKGKTNKLLTAIALLLLLSGLAVIFYPNVSQYYYELQVKQTIVDYEDRLAAYTEARREAGDGEWDWLYELMVEYNEKLYENGQSELVDAFSYQQVDFSLVRFGFDEEMIGYLSIPKMDTQLPIYLGANRGNLAKGAAHLTQTSLPVGGVNTNAVFAAHRGMGTAAMFRDIESLEIGDEVYITNFRETLIYKVVETAVISPSDIDTIVIQEGRDIVTLITCHPYRHNYQRYVVYCERAEDTAGEQSAANEQMTAAGILDLFRYYEMSESQRDIFLERWLPVGIVCFILVIVIIILVFRQKRARKAKRQQPDENI